VQHGSRCTGDSPVLSLGNPILLGVVGYGHMSFDPMLGTEVYKLSGGILSSIIRPQDLDLLFELVLHKRYELLELLEDLTLGLQKIDLGIP
jgi:hypothetical protein